MPFLLTFIPEFSRLYIIGLRFVYKFDSPLPTPRRLEEGGGSGGGDDDRVSDSNNNDPTIQGKYSLFDVVSRGGSGSASDGKSGEIATSIGQQQQSELIPLMDFPASSSSSSSEKDKKQTSNSDSDSEKENILFQTNLIKKNKSSSNSSSSITSDNSIQQKQFHKSQSIDSSTHRSTSD